MDGRTRLHIDHLLGLTRNQDSAFPDVVAGHSAIQTPCFWIFPRHTIDTGDATVGSGRNNQTFQPAF